MRSMGCPFSSRTVPGGWPEFADRDFAAGESRSPTSAGRPRFRSTAPGSLDNSSSYAARLKVCSSQVSIEAVEALQARGFKARGLKDGFLEWKAAGLAVEAHSFRGCHTGPYRLHRVEPRRSAECRGGRKGAVGGAARGCPLQRRELAEK